jgi:hypothetical protein
MAMAHASAVIDMAALAVGATRVSGCCRTEAEQGCGDGEDCEDALHLVFLLI